MFLKGNKRSILLGSPVGQYSATTCFNGAKERAKSQLKLCGMCPVAEVVFVVVYLVGTFSSGVCDIFFPQPGKKKCVKCPHSARLSALQLYEQAFPGCFMAPRAERGVFAFSQGAHG